CHWSGLGGRKLPALGCSALDFGPHQPGGLSCRRPAGILPQAGVDHHDDAAHHAVRRHRSDGLRHLRGGGLPCPGRVGGGGSGQRTRKEPGLDQLTAGLRSMANTFVVAAEECDLTQPMCAPHDVTELFVLPDIVGPINRTVILMILAALIVVAVLYFAFRKPSLIPSKFQAAVESLTSFVRDEVAVGIIGPEGVKYFPYLLSLFMFILVGNLFEITPFINFPITSRMAIPGFLALLTYVVYLV